jgi:hypothetical protein
MNSDLEKLLLPLLQSVSLLIKAPHLSSIHGFHFSIDPIHLNTLIERVRMHSTVSPKFSTPQGDLRVSWDSGNHQNTLRETVILLQQVVVSNPYILPKQTSGQSITEFTKVVNWLINSLAQAVFIGKVPKSSEFCTILERLQIAPEKMSSSISLLPFEIIPSQHLVSVLAWLLDSLMGSIALRDEMLASDLSVLGIFFSLSPVFLEPLRITRLLNGIFLLMMMHAKKKKNHKHGR